MITSVVITGKHSIVTNSSNKIKVGEQVLSLEKEIPFVRYRFDNYLEDDVEYILKTMEKFKYSTHLIEINLDANTESVMQLVLNKIPNIAKYIYLDINDEIANNKKLYDETINMLLRQDFNNIDRIMLRDKSSNLDTVSYKAIVKQCISVLKQNGITNITEQEFGVCSSPLSFGDLACLTAVKARELMSKYSTISDVALPSANHQCMNCCGCIRYLVISSDLEAPNDSKSKLKSSGEHKQKSESTSKTKVNKTPVHFSSHRL